MDMRDLVRDTDWTGFRLPADLNIRIGLHAGPVYGRASRCRSAGISSAPT